MRILLFSDHHAHAFKSYSTILPNGINSRLWDSIQVLNQIAKLVKQNAVDVVLFGGDLFHARGTLNVQTFNLVFDAIAHIRINAQVGLLVGNHDQTNRTGDVHSVYSLGSVVQVLDKPAWYTFQIGLVTLNVFALPYHPDKEVLQKSIQTAVRSHPRGLDPVILLGHVGITGAVVGSNFVLVDEHNLTVADLQASEFDQVFLGHYHEPQRLDENVFYLGATHQHNWGDSGSKRGCWLWDTQENQNYSKPTQILLNYPQFVVLDQLDNVDQSAVRDNYVRVKIPNGLSHVQQLRSEEALLGLGARVVEFVDSLRDVEVSTASFHPGMDVDEMISSYVLENSPDSLHVGQLISLGRSLMLGEK